MERAILGGAVTDFLPIQWKDAPGVGLPLASPDMLYKERTLEIRLGASLFVSLGAGDILSTTCDDYLLACP